MRFTEGETTGGMTVLLEENPSARSVSVGFFVSTGARDETPDIEGVSHFLEHMAFKSTKKREALDVSRELDRLGSRANAYTSWERTVYYAQVLPEFLPEIIDLLAEMIIPALLPEDFDVEKKVILEEIEMYNDRPEFLLFENMMAKHYEGRPLGNRILGTPESIAGLTHEAMREYHDQRYVSDRIALVVAGNFAAEDVLGQSETLAIPTRIAGRSIAEPPEKKTVSVTLRPDDVQEHFLHAWPGPKNDDLAPRIEANILSLVLGDDEGSRLSWALTHRGLVESVDSGIITFEDDGLFYAGFSSNPEHFEESRDIFTAEIRALADGISDEEFERAKTKYAARTVMGSETSMGRMSSLGGDRLDGLPYIPLKEELNEILRVKKQSIQELAGRLAEEPLVIGAIGPIPEESI